MANQSSDRQRMRNDLRELARLAKPGSDSPVHGFDTADSSGYVDLSAYSTSDAGWVDRELARARKGAPPPPARAAGARTIDVLTPASMAPVSLELSDGPEDTMSVRPSRARGVLYTTMGLAAAAAVGLLAFTLAKHPPPPAQASTTVAAAAVAPPPVDVPTPPPTDTSAATPPTTPATVAVAPTPTTPAAATVVSTSKARKTFGAPRAHAAAHASAAAPVHAAATAPAAVVIPRAKPSSGGDSLMDLIKKSVATGK